MGVAAARNESPLGHRLNLPRRRRIGADATGTEKTSGTEDLSQTKAANQDVMEEEADAFPTEAISAKAHNFDAFLAQDGDEIDSPDVDHPDRDVLLIADKALGKLRSLKATSSLINICANQIDLYEKELRRHTDFLRSREHRIAFIGSTGVGKSTAISKLAGLVRPGESTLAKQTVLETGGGRTTLCEVHILVGPQVGLRIVPRSEESIRKDVEDFAEHLIQPARDSVCTASARIDEADTLGISEEVVRAIRNMAGLVRKNDRREENRKKVRIDPAHELAVQYPSVRELSTQILERMNLRGRTRREALYPKNCAEPWQQWLQRTFEELSAPR